MADGVWLKDFKFYRDRVHIHSTNITIPFNLALITDVLVWLPFWAWIRILSLFGRTESKDRFTLSFSPYQARPWYLIWAVTMLAGGRYGRPGASDVHIYFEDTTSPELERGKQAAAENLNFNCPSIAKSRVARVFEDVFGYPLSVDPQTWTGQAVAKSEKNGVHNGRIVDCPCPAEPDTEYQRVIDNRDGDYVRDLRCPVIGGEISLIWVKRRPLSRRFDNMNATATLHSPDELLTAEERQTIKRFMAAMGLDWGGIDILRDNEDGRIYIVDVNKTDMGPPLALPFKDKIRSTRILARRWRSFLKSRGI